MKKKEDPHVYSCVCYPTFYVMPPPSCVCILRVGGCGRDSQHDGARTRMMQTKRKKKMTKKKQAFNVAIPSSAYGQAYAGRAFSKLCNFAVGKGCPLIVIV